MSECECGHDELDHDHRDVCELCECNEFVALDDEDDDAATRRLNACPEGAEDDNDL